MDATKTDTVNQGQESKNQDQETSLASRVAQMQSESAVPTKEEESGEEGGSLIDKLKAAGLKEDLIKEIEDERKSFKSGYDKKFQKLAGEKKEFESMRDDFMRMDAKKIGELMENPEFVKASQEWLQMNETLPEDMSYDEYSQLNPKEKAKIDELHKKMKALEEKEQNAQLNAQHESLKGKYKDYSVEGINEFLGEIQSGKRSIGFEDLYKVMNYEKALENAYKMGKEESGAASSVKFNSSSVPGNSNTMPEIKIEGTTPDEKRNSFFSQKKTKIFGRR